MTSVNVGGIYYTVSMDTADLIRGSQTATKQLSIMESRLNDVAAAAKAVVSGMAVMKIIDIADEWGQYASRLKMATQSTDEYNIVQERMIQSANMTFRSVNETKESFIQMSPVLRQMGYDLGESIDAIDTFSGLLVVNSASAERAKASQNALSGALQKGSLDADGWMTILSTMPSIVDLLVQTTGKSAEEIRQLGASGKQSVRDLTEALVQGYLPVMQKVAEMPTTVRDAMQSLANGFQEYIGKANEAAGITAAIASGIALLGNNFSMVAEVGLAAAGGAMLSYAVNAGKAVAASIEKRKAAIEVSRALVAQTTVTARKTAADVIAAKHQVMAARSDEQRTAALSALRLAKVADVQATRLQEAANTSLAKSQSLVRGAASGVLGLMGGPVGLAVTAGLAAAAFLAIKDKGDQARTTLEDMKKPLDDVANGFRRLSHDQQGQKVVEYTEAHALAVKKAADAYRELERAVSIDLEFTNPDFAFSSQMDEYLEKLRTAKREGQALEPVLREMAKAANLSPDYIAGWTKLAGEFDRSTEVAGIASRALVTVSNIYSMLKHSANDAAAGVSNANAAMGGTTEAGQKAIAQLERQLALYGKAGSAAGYLYDIEQARQGKGQFAGIDPKELDKLAAGYQKLADLEAAGHNKGPSKAQQAAEKLKREQEQIAEAAARYIDTLQQQYDQVDRMTNLERLEYEIKAKKVILGDKEYKTAVDLAEKLDDRATKEREIAEAHNIKNAQLAAERQLMAEIAGYNSDIAGMTMGDRAAAQMQERLQLMQQFAERIQQIDDQRRSALAGKNAQQQKETNALYDAVLKIEQDYQQKSLIAFDRYVDRKREKEADWATGAEKAWANYVEESQAAASQAESAMSSWLSSTEDALVKFVQTGKLSFKDLANSIIADLARIAAKQMITGLLGNIFGSFMGGWSAAGVQSSGSYTAPVSGGSVTGTSLPPMSKSAPSQREHGGPVTANQMYEVNEKGKPELLSYGGKQYLMTGNQSGNVSPMNGVGGGGAGTLKVIIENKGQAVEATSARMESNGLEQVLRVTIQQEIRKEAQNLAGGRGVLDQGLKSRYVMTPRR